MGVYAHMMKGSLIAFTVPTGKDRTKASSFAKAFYGQETSSHKGKYRYRRHGLLDDVPHRRLIRGVIIIRNDDVEQVTMFLKQHSAQYYIRIVELTEKDCEELGMQVE